MASEATCGNGTVAGSGLAAKYLAGTPVREMNE